jgi:SAM-dependent methyltransferase
MDTIGPGTEGVVPGAPRETPAAADADAGGFGVLRERLIRAFTGRSVLQLGSGTGEWTQVFAARAAQVTVVEPGEEALALARSVPYPAGRVEFLRASLNALPDLGRRHDSLFAAGRWSRVPEDKLDAFLRQAVDAVAPGALVAFLGERGATGMPGESELIKRASRCGWGANVELLPGYWLVTWWAAA